MRREVGSIVEVTPGVFRVSVSVGHSSTTGKRRRPAKIVRGTERDAEMALARLLLEAGKLPETEVTVRQFLEEMYLPHVESRRRIRTVDGYRSIITHHVLPRARRHGARRPDSVPAVQVDGRPHEGERRPTRGRNAAARLPLPVLRAQAGGVWGLAEDNPLRAVEIAAAGTPQAKDVLTVKEAAQYLEAFHGHALEPLVVLALACGLRRSELAGLDWSDSRLRRGHGDECAAGLHDRKGGVIVEEPKSIESRRTIAVPQWALGVLKPLRGIWARWSSRTVRRWLPGASRRSTAAR